MKLGAVGRFGLGVITGAALATVVGCAATPQMRQGAAAVPADANIAAKSPAPKVQDCGIVTLSTPVLYACNGKVYTEYALQHIREQNTPAP